MVVNQFRVKGVEMVLSRKRTWSGHGRNAQKFDLIFSPWGGEQHLQGYAAPNGVMLVSDSRPQLTMQTLGATFQRTLLADIEPWEDKDAYVLSYLIGALNVGPGNVNSPEWKRNDVLHTPGGNRRYALPEGAHWHMVLTREMRGELRVWLDRQLEEGTIVQGNW